MKQNAASKPQVVDNPELLMNPVKSSRILIVEDEPAIIDAYKTILETKNETPKARRSSRLQVVPQEPAKADLVSTASATDSFQLVCVTNPDAAIEEVKKSIASQQSFAMGFFDVLLGQGKDGIELVRELHQIDPTLFAVFVTAYHDRSVDAIDRLLGPGMGGNWDYINKPFSHGEILQKARNAVALFNLRKEKELRDRTLAEANQLLLINERTSSVAAVARSVGHEFGNILLQIMGRAELSREGSPENMKAALDTIFRASETAASILERFKSLSNPAHARQPHQAISIEAPLKEALELLSHDLKIRNIKISLVTAPTPRLWATHHSLVQVFVNLLINASHAMEKNGQIDFDVHPLDENNIEVTLRDHGPGIPPELLEKVMEPFFTTKKDKGTGLGLAICREIIEIEHAGSFRVSNHPKGGALFTIQLPLKVDISPDTTEDEHES